MVKKMSKYTIELRKLLNDPIAKEKIDKALSTYPMYIAKSKNEHIPNIIPTREELNKKILNYYKYREIGFETFGRFLDELEISMNEIMPYYNQMFFTCDQDFNIIFNVDYVKTYDTTRNSEGTLNSNIEGTSQSSGTNESNVSDTNQTNATTNGYTKNVESSTPQNDISTTNKGIDSVSYADKITWNNSSNEDSATSTGSSQTNSTSNLEGTNTTSQNDTTKNKQDEKVIETTKGNFGVVSSQDLIAKYREIILNIEQDIINDPRISELFMLVY